jgi:ankyrin repeat protein
MRRIGSLAPRILATLACLVLSTIACAAEPTLGMNEQPIHDAARLGKRPDVEAILKATPKARDARTPLGITPLHYAAMNEDSGPLEGAACRRRGGQCARRRRPHATAHGGILDAHGKCEAAARSRR